MEQVNPNEIIPELDEIEDEPEELELEPDEEPEEFDDGDLDELDFEDGRRF